MNYYSRMPIEKIDEKTVQKVVEYFNELFKNKDVNFTQPTAANFNDYATATRSVDNRLVTFNLTDDVIRTLYEQYLCAIDLGVNKEQGGFGTGPYGKYFECITGLYVHTDANSNEPYIIATLSEIEGKKKEVSEVQEQLNPIIKYCKERFDIVLNVEEVLVDKDGILVCVRAKGFKDIIKGSPPPEQAGGQLQNQTPSETINVSDITYNKDQIDSALANFIKLFFHNPDTDIEKFRGIIFNDEAPNDIQLPLKTLTPEDNDRDYEYQESQLADLIKTAFILYLISNQKTDYAYLVPYVKSIYRNDNNAYTLLVTFDDGTEDPTLNNKQWLERLLYFGKLYNIYYSKDEKSSDIQDIFMTDNGVQIYNITNLHIAAPGEAPDLDIKAGLPWATAKGNSYEEILTEINTNPGVLEGTVAQEPNATNNVPTRIPTKYNAAFNRLTKPNIDKYIKGTTGEPKNIDNVMKMAGVILGANDITNAAEMYEKYAPLTDKIRALSDDEFEKEYGTKYTKDEILTILDNVYELYVKYDNRIEIPQGLPKTTKIIPKPEGAQEPSVRHKETVSFGVVGKPGETADYNINVNNNDPNLAQQAKSFRNRNEAAAQLENRRGGRRKTNKLRKSR
jgi:hypothetical protein